MSECCKDNPSPDETCCKDHALGDAPPSEADLDAMAQLSTTELIARYRWGVEHFDARLFQLTPEQLDRRFDPADALGLWSCRELVGHLADAELAYTQRIRQTTAEDNPIFANWDEHAYIDSGLYARTKPGGFVATVYTLRVWTGELLETLDDAQWARKGMHPQRGAFTCRRVVEFATWHLERHAWFLNQKMLAMLGPMPEQPEGGCCQGSACACEATKD